MLNFKQREAHRPKQCTSPIVSKLFLFRKEA